MATDDSMSDDVFETESEMTASLKASDPCDGRPTPSPTGYRDYKPDPQLLTPIRQQDTGIAHKTILLGDSGVGKTSLLVQFDTGKFQSGTFSATVGIGFTCWGGVCTRMNDMSAPAPARVQMVERVIKKLRERRMSERCQRKIVPQWSQYSHQHHQHNYQNGGVTRQQHSHDHQQPTYVRHRHSISSAETCDLVGKVMLLGDSGVGKTCLLVRFRDNMFLSGNFISTVGIDFRNKVVAVDDVKVKLQIWDTAGQERFRSVTHAYYRDAHALLLLYDVTNKTSFDNIRAWLGEIREYAQDDVVIMLLGNKSDCQSSERMVRKEDGERLAREYNVTFMETSAKTGQNVDLAFMAIARELKARKNGTHNRSSFNVQDYVREHTSRASCPPCSS